MSPARAGSILFLLVAMPVICSAADLPGANADGWHTWRASAIDSAPELCCFSWNNGVATQKRCNLDGRHGGFSTTDNGPFPSDDIQVYALLRSGALAKIRVLSSQCPVTTDSEITDLGLVDADESVEWLAQIVSRRSNISDEAITAVAVHAGDSARRFLLDTATSDTDEDNRESAIFWMAQVRIDETASELKKIMFADRSADMREHTAFAYSQSTASDRAEMLIRQGKEDADADVRSQAWFWLTQIEAVESEAEIRKVLNNERDEDVREQAVFALSQLPEDRAVKALADILEDGRLDMHMREQALFWLAQIESDEAFEYFERLLSDN